MLSQVNVQHVTFISYVITLTGFILVPCYRRCHQMEVLPENEKVIKLTDDDEGWVDTHHGVAIEQISESVQDMTLDQSSNTPQMVFKYGSPNIGMFCLYNSYIMVCCGV